MEHNPILYLLIRNDLPSMNPGKAVAHGAHAANQFVYERKLWGEASSPVNYGIIESLYVRWIGVIYAGFDEITRDVSPGFGTTVTLHTNLDQMRAAVRVASALGAAAGLTVDPSYPYVTTKELADLITHPEAYPPVVRSPTEVICFREEITAAYVFGDKDDLRPVVGNFPLMP